jgi:hypothetical protein
MRAPRKTIDHAQRLRRKLATPEVIVEPAHARRRFWPQGLSPAERSPHPDLLPARREKEALASRQRFCLSARFAAQDEGIAKSRGKSQCCIASAMTNLAALRRLQADVVGAAAGSRAA